MSYKVQYKVNKSRIIRGEKFPYNQIRVVDKALFDYIKATFPTEFNFYEEAPKTMAAKKAENKTDTDLGIIKKTNKSSRKRVGGIK